MMELNTLLVPVDFSDISKAAFLGAAQLATGDDCAVILLHVIDLAVPQMVEKLEFATVEEVVSKLRTQAESTLEAWKQLVEKPIDVQIVVCEGQPFMEIVRKAEEFQVDAILMSKLGNRGQMEKLLFGSTAERVTRWATRPVIVLPPV